MHRFAIAAGPHPLADNGLAHARWIAWYPVGIAFGRVNGGKPCFDIGVQDLETLRLVHRPAKDITPQYQGFDNEFTASKGAAIHEATPFSVLSLNVGGRVSFVCWPTGSGQISALRLDEVPFITIEVFKHRDPTIGLVPWCFEKFHPACQHACMVAGKVIGLQKSHDAATGLIADGVVLSGAIGPGQQQSGAAAVLGPTTTQRLPPPISISASRAKPSWSR